MLVNKNYKDLKISVIGCGNWGKNLIRVMSELGVLHSVCDLDSEKAALISQNYHVSASTLESIANDASIQAVMLATPSPTHFMLAQFFLNKGKHVFVEKPFALQAQDASRLAMLASKHQKILMVGHLLQYHDGFKAFKARIQDGAIGELQFVHSSRFNLGKFKTEQNVLWDFAPHDISMVLSLFENMPVQIEAVGSNHLHHTKLDWSVIHLKFEKNQQAHIYSSWLHPHKEQKLTAVGSKGMLIFDDCQPWSNKLKIIPYPPEWSDGLPNPVITAGENIALIPNEPLVNECSHFLECIVEGKQPNTNGEEALRVTTVLESAMGSINNKSLLRNQAILEDVCI